MNRTKQRPLVQGAVSTKNALIFAIALCLGSIVILDTFVNRLTCILTIGGMAGYALIYTLYLKRATPQNIVIGGLSGALPPLLGWTAITNEVHPHGLLLVLLIFIWTPPHFWALAIHRRDDYAKAGVPMLPVTHGIEFTKTQILLYTILLLLTSFLPYLSGMSGLFYLTVATLSGLGFMGYAVLLKFRPNKKLAMQTFWFSIVYLLLVFPALLIDRAFF
jgi:protoheme IX farnesyltransferase